MIFRLFIFIIISALFIFLGISTISLNYDMVGLIGKTIGRYNLKLFGSIAYIYPFLSVFILYFIYKKITKFNLRALELLFGGLILFFTLLILQAFVGGKGVIGELIVLGLLDFIGRVGIIVFMLMLLTLSFVLFYDQNSSLKFMKFRLLQKKDSEADSLVVEQKNENMPDESVIKTIKPLNGEKEELIINKEDGSAKFVTTSSELKSEPKDEKKVEVVTKEPLKLGGVQHLKEVEQNKKILDTLEKGAVEKPKDFELPPLKFLKDPPKQTIAVDEKEIDKKIYDLLEKLKRFKIDGDVVRTYSGPVVTTFEFRPAAHIKISKILTLEDDLAMALKAKTIRIQAPIPGKNAVGIEIPNKQIETIYLKEILDSDIFKSAKSSLTVALGKDIVGQPFVTDLKTLPHLLIAGTTGSGKSVGINAMLLSLLYRNSPKSLRLLMIDPKMLEFSMYNEIPHLLTPVITEPKKAIGALSNLVLEMERRYKLMSKTKTKNIENYNEKIAKFGSDAEKLPYIVVIIDELADLMMTSGKDVEFYIGRLAQMARASGIHLIVATQRPSVDVVTGFVKANLPSRISFRVSQKIDSKVILDEMGADGLLGRGDMLLKLPGYESVRLHAPFVSEEEIIKIVEFIKAQGGACYDELFLESQKETKDGESSDVSELDELYEEAKNIVLSENKTSISYLQRRLKIGYNRAASIMEQLEEMGVLSEINAKGQREIL